MERVLSPQIWCFFLNSTNRLFGIRQPEAARSVVKKPVWELRGGQVMEALEANEASGGQE